MIVEEALVIIDTYLRQEPLNNLQELVFCESWQGKSYQEIAQTAGYDPDYIKSVAFKLWQLLSKALGEKINKNNAQSVFRRHSGQNQILEVPKALTKDVAISQSQDWGDAIDVSVFYGRTEELATLQQWIIQERCRLVAILGMGGIGKTALSVKLAQQIQGEFDYLIWRSLRNAPCLSDLLVELLHFLSSKQITSIPENITGKISLLKEYLRSSRCLIVLDNAESIMLGSDRAGYYREGYEEYGDFFRTIGEVSHQSCLLLTSREKPKELNLLEGIALRIRSLQISGLSEGESKQILQAKTSLVGAESDWEQLIKYYTGNPLALKIVATTIQDLFNGKISEFLKQGLGCFGDIRDLLKQQCHRLSDLEKEIICWLAINREPVSIADVRSDMVSPVSLAKLIEALESLGRRSLIEKISTSFTLQPVVMEYTTEHLITKVTQEIATNQINLLNKFAFIKAQAKDYVRATQIKLILQPIIKELTILLRSKKNIDYHLKQILGQLQQESPLEPGYIAGNIINILAEIKEYNLNNYDFSYLTIWQAHLNNVDLSHTNFTCADIASSVFAEAMNCVLAVTFSPDGKLLATSDNDGEIRVWQVSEAKQILDWSADKSWLHSIAFSPDSQIIASGGIDTNIRLWNINTGKCLKTLKGHNNLVFSVSVSPSGQVIASGSTDGSVRLWDTNTGECLLILDSHSEGGLYVAFSPDGHILATASHKQSVRLWDVNTGQCLKVLKGHTEAVFSVAFNPNGKILATGSNDSTARLWDINTGECLMILAGHSQGKIRVAFSPNAQVLATGSADQTARLWDINTGQCLKILQGYDNCFW